MMSSFTPENGHKGTMKKKNVHLFHFHSLSIQNLVSPVSVDW